jgi:hypothetical protein
MGVVPADWLINGCMSLGGQPKERKFSLTTCKYLEELHGIPFKVRQWPRKGYRHTLWWYEKDADPATTASFFVALDNARGPGLYAGVCVEKGYEDRGVARTQSRKEGKDIEEYLLTERWDWHHFLRSLTDLPDIAKGASESLGNRELFVWAEYHRGTEQESRYYVIRDGVTYQRGLLRPISWKRVVGFISKRRPALWGQFMVVRAFNLSEACSGITEQSIWDVFEALKPIRDLWRGSS